MAALHLRSCAGSLGLKSGYSYLMVVNVSDGGQCTLCLTDFVVCFFFGLVGEQ